MIAGFFFWIIELAKRPKRLKRSRKYQRKDWLDVWMELLLLLLRSEDAQVESREDKKKSIWENAAWCRNFNAEYKQKKAKVEEKKTFVTPGRRTEESRDRDGKGTVAEDYKVIGICGLNDKRANGCRTEGCSRVYTGTWTLDKTGACTESRHPGLSKLKSGPERAPDNDVWPGWKSQNQIESLNWLSNCSLMSKSWKIRTVVRREWVTGVVGMPGLGRGGERRAEERKRARLSLLMNRCRKSGSVTE